MARPLFVCGVLLVVFGNALLRGIELGGLRVELGILRGELLVRRHARCHERVEFGACLVELVSPRSYLRSCLRDIRRVRIELRFCGRKLRAGLGELLGGRVELGF